MQILLVEDNQKMAENLKKVFSHHDYQVDLAFTGEKALELAEINRYQLIILDLALPDIDGQTICKTLRQTGITTPILMLTARIDLESKVTGLDGGADDYLTKPFLIEELLARTRALLRRKTEIQTTLVNLAGLEVDLKAKTVRRSQELIKLSPIEFRILEFLLLHRGEAQSSADIYEAVWGSDNDEMMFSDTLKVHLARMRKKLKQDVIKTVTGFGYLIEKAKHSDA